MYLAPSWPWRGNTIDKVRAFILVRENIRQIISGSHMCSEETKTSE